MHIKDAISAIRLVRRNFLKGAGTLTMISAFSTEPRAEEGNPTEQGSWLDEKIWGYADKHSVVPGGKINVMLSVPPGSRTVNGYLKFSRIGAASEPELIFESGNVAVESHPIPATASSAGANWVPALFELDTSTWRPGVITAQFVSEDGKIDKDIFQLIVRNPQTTDILVKLGTNTYQAYNEWGGSSLYPTKKNSNPGTLVSFDRPCDPLFFKYDLFLVRFLEKLARERGFTLSYTTDFDVHSAPESALNCKLLISSAHDEYWTKEIFDVFEDRIHRRGGNTIFMGANAAYWQARFSDFDRPSDAKDQGRQLVCCKWAHDPIERRTSREKASLLITHQFRYRARRPETMLMGVAFQDWFPADAEPMRRATYYVSKVDLPYFEGTGWKVGDPAADVVGYEWDNRDPEGDGKRLWDRDKSLIPEIPSADLEVLFKGPATGLDRGAGVAEAVFFRSHSGAKVFSTGTTRWSWGLSHPGFTNGPFRRFNTNIILDLLS